MFVVQIILHNKLILYQQSTIKKRDFFATSCSNYKHFDNQPCTTTSLDLPYLSYFVILIKINRIKYSTYKL